MFLCRLLEQPDVRSALSTRYKSGILTSLFLLAIQQPIHGGMLRTWLGQIARHPISEIVLLLRSLLVRGNGQVRRQLEDLAQRGRNGADEEVEDSKDAAGDALGDDLA